MCRVGFGKAPSPLGPGRFKVEFTVSDAMRAKLERLQQLSRHRIPNGDLDVILEPAVDSLIAKRERERFGKVAAPRASRRDTSSSRYIPRQVRREVATRDDERCTFESDEGRRCDGRAFVQFHHETPFARGGASSVSNLRLLCRAHNLLYAERDLEGISCG